MSEKLIPLFERRSIDGLMWEAHHLFKDIEKKFGRERAREIFEFVSSDLSDDEVRELKNLAILHRVDSMQPLNVAELARQLVAENAEALQKGEPAPNGPRGSTNLMTMDKHIRNLIEWRDNGIADATWVCLGKVRWPKHLSIRLFNL